MKHTTNTLSTLYRSIDQTKISDKAKETLKKLRLATGNFVGKDEEAKQLFVDFFNKLKESKPIAVKTTPEYKKALRDAQRERGKALGEKRKKESQDKKGTGNDIDASRPAKPYGWRMRGKHNYKKPTRADITEGRAYYEGRVNRSDVKRKKYPMLERGGYMNEGGLLKEDDYVWNALGKKLIVDKVTDNEYYLVGFGQSSASPFLKSKVDNYIKKGEWTLKPKQYAKGGYMAKGGDVGTINTELINVKNNIMGTTTLEMKIKGMRKPQNFIVYPISAEQANKPIMIQSDTRFGFLDLSTGEGLMSQSHANGAYSYHFQTDKKVHFKLSETDVQRIKSDLSKKASSKVGNSVVFSDNSGANMMAKGGAIENQYEGRTAEDVWDSYTKEQRLHFLYDHAEEINEYKGLKDESENPWFNKSYKSEWNMLDKDVQNRFANHVRGGQYAKGGYMENGGEVGKSFTISEMNEKLNRMFPDSFGFSVGTFSKEGNKTRNSSALIANENDPFRGLKDSDIDSKLFFPQYKKMHDIRYRIYQGGENTYFYFNLESEKGDEYIGQFGFKDQGDVPSSYITRFIAFLMEQYGLPFEVNHSVMAEGGEVFYTEKHKND